MAEPLLKTASLRPPAEPARPTCLLTPGVHLNLNVPTLNPEPSKAMGAMSSLISVLCSIRLAHHLAHHVGALHCGHLLMLLVDLQVFTVQAQKAIPAIISRFGTLKC